MTYSCKWCSASISIITTYKKKGLSNISYNFDSYNLISKKSLNPKPENLPMVSNFNGDIDICVHCAHIFPKNKL